MSTLFSIQGGILLFSYPSNWAHYSREYIIQGGILFEEIRYMIAPKKSQAEEGNFADMICWESLMVSNHCKREIITSPNMQKNLLKTLQSWQYL